VQVVKDACLTPGKALPKEPSGLRSFEYHCAHSYWAYNEVTAAIFGEEGEKINKTIIEEFAEDYGQELADVIKGYQNTNFNVCD
jgi:hypothetical protein